jgi:hypothetical protein
VHLASALAFGQRLGRTPWFACADGHLLRAAQSCGLQVLDVSSDT